MAKINLTSFYDHDKFMQDVHDGDKIISQSDKELARQPVEECEFDKGDLVISTGTGTVIAGQFGLVVDKELVGKYWRVAVSWNKDNVPSNNYITYERCKDIKMFTKNWK
jgi:hypothetical protein